MWCRLLLETVGELLLQWKRDFHTSVKLPYAYVVVSLDPLGFVTSLSL